MADMLGNSLRGLGRLLALVTVVIGSACAYAVRSSHRRHAMAKAHWLKLTCGRALRALGVRVESDGEPAHGAVIVVNHLGYLDILVLASLAPMVFVSKNELRGWPLFGWFAEKAGTRFIDRGRRGDVARIGEELGPLMSAGVTVVLFLEGTTTDGRDVLPFRSSLLEPVIKNQWHVVPAGLNYRVPAGRSVQAEVCWWGDMTLVPHLWNFMTLPWVLARLSWGSARTMSGAEDRKELAAALRETVVDLKGGPHLEKT